MVWSAESIVSGFESDYIISGDDISITNIASLENAIKSDLSFCSLQDDTAKPKISNSNAGIILCHKKFREEINPKSDQQLVFVTNPKLVFIQFVNDKFSKNIEPKISESAKISSSANIGKNCFIDENVVIGENSSVSDNTIIFAGVNISNSSIGHDCIIYPGSIIGMDGFSYERKSDFSLEKFPHFGKVLIGNNVEINSNCTIARGSLSDTIIDDGTKLDALVHVAHNSHIGKNCMLTAGTVVGGSTKIGNNCWLGLNSSILDRLQIDDNVIVGAGSTVTKNFTKNWLL